MGFLIIELGTTSMSCAALYVGSVLQLLAALVTQVALTIAEANGRSGNARGGPSLGAWQAADGDLVGDLDVLLAVQALGAVPHHIQLPEAARGNLCRP